MRKVVFFFQKMQKENFKKLKNLWLWGDKFVGG